ncbi:MAG: CoA transferase [Anaerolineales bacterium]|nr:CoA transferase [Anaerolineales bacterium]
MQEELAPLNGVRVIELTEALAGPYAAMLLGDLGADVVKIERPGVGDQARRWGARLPGGESAYFCSTNRNKRSLTLNIQSEAGQAVMRRLLAGADVLLCNIPRDDSLRRARLDWDTLHAEFPRLIFASITGYGRSGPYAGRSGYDLVAQGESGLMSITGTAETVPMRFPIPLADMTTGMYAVIGILAALRAREQTGQGQLIDLSLLESHAAYLAVLAGDVFATGRPPQPIGNAHPGIVPYQVFHTADKDVIIAVGSDRQWATFCEVIGLGAEVRDDPRFATNSARLQNRAALVALIEERLTHFGSAELLEKLRHAEIPCGPINTVTDLLNDPHYRARGNIIEQVHPTAGAVRSLANPVRLTATPPVYRRPPPALGEHTAEVLGELGYSAEAIAALRNEGVV